MPIMLKRQPRNVITWQVVETEGGQSVVRINAEFPTLEQAVAHWLAGGAPAWAFIRNSATGWALCPADKLGPVIREMRAALSPVQS